jgi:hypothetical protein
MASDAGELTPSGTSERLERRIAFLCLLLGIPVLLVVSHFAGLGSGRAAGLCVSVDALVAGLRWRSTQKLRILCALFLILVLQAIVIGVVPFGDESMPGITLLAPALVIYLFDECVIFLFRLGRGSGPGPS